jgi:hypothetical protein
MISVRQPLIAFKWRNSLILFAIFQSFGWRSLRRQRFVQRQEKNDETLNQTRPFQSHDACPGPYPSSAYFSDGARQTTDHA